MIVCVLLGLGTVGDKAPSSPSSGLATWQLDGRSRGRSALEDCPQDRRIFC